MTRAKTRAKLDAILKQRELALKALLDEVEKRGRLLDIALKAYGEVPEDTDKK